MSNKIEYKIIENFNEIFEALKDEENMIVDKSYYETLYKEHKTLVGAGHWFETDKKYMRIGFGWPTNDQLKQGLANIETTIIGLKK